MEPKFGSWTTMPDPVEELLTHSNELDGLTITEARQVALMQLLGIWKRKTPKPEPVPEDSPTEGA